MNRPESAPNTATFMRSMFGSSRDPMIQKTMPYRSSLRETAMISITREDEIKLIITPVNNMPCVFSAPVFMLRLYTKIVTNTAPRKPEMGKAIIPIISYHLKNHLNEAAIIHFVS